MSEKLIINQEMRYGTLAQFNAAVLPAGMNHQPWWITDLNDIGVIYATGKRIGMSKPKKAYELDLSAGPPSLSYNVYSGRNYEIVVDGLMEVGSSASLTPIGGIGQFYGIVATTAGNFVSAVSSEFMKAPCFVKYYNASVDDEQDSSILAIVTNPVGITGQGLRLIPTYLSSNGYEALYRQRLIFKATADKVITVAKLLDAEIAGTVVMTIQEID